MFFASIVTRFRFFCFRSSSDESSLLPAFSAIEAAWSAALARASRASMGAVSVSCANPDSDVAETDEARDRAGDGAAEATGMIP
jgi:hypothetical protein